VGVSMINWKAWQKRMNLPAFIMAGSETRQFFKKTAPSRVTAMTMTVAMMVARQAQGPAKGGVGPLGDFVKRVDGFQRPKANKIIKVSGMETLFKSDMPAPKRLIRVWSGLSL
jgi:hypothetical protein